MDWTPRKDNIITFNAGAPHPIGTEDSVRYIAGAELPKSIRMKDSSQN